MRQTHFMYDPDVGFETYPNEAQAREAAQDAIDSYRDNASEGWSDEASGVCWGELKQWAVEKQLPEKGMFEGELVNFVDYVLEDI